MIGFLLEMLRIALAVAALAWLIFVAIAIPNGWIA